MDRIKIAVLPGDGIGPEICAVGVDVTKAACSRFGITPEFSYALVGAAAIDACGDPFPAETLKICQDADAVLFAAVGDPKYDHNPQAKVRPEQGLLAMRKQLRLFANVRPVATFAALIDKSPLRPELVRDADFICIRELTGGMYFGEKHEGDDTAWDTCIYSRHEIERILRVAYDYAMRRRRHLTVVDKANVLASSRLWRKVAKEMAPEYPEVTTDFMYVDNAAMRMIQDPCFFDVMVTENTFGDILTDEGSVISGSMGLLPSASLGEGTPLFEPIVAGSRRKKHRESAGAGSVGGDDARASWLSGRRQSDTKCCRRKHRGRRTYAGHPDRRTDAGRNPRTGPVAGRLYCQDIGI